MGVDIFFVVSGFLMTRCLLEDVQFAGGIDIGRFWAKRVRRIVPASLAVLFIGTLASFLLPQSHWEDTLQDVVASGLYIQNWSLLSRGDYYFATDAPASLFRHYWSLSIEEQFYFIWPIVMVWCLIASARGLNSQGGANNEHGMKFFAAVVVAITVVSFIYGGCLSSDIGNKSYYSTFSRMWEISSGGLLAIFVNTRPSVVHSGRLRTNLGFVGLGLLMVGMAYSKNYTSVNALPVVVGTVLVIFSAYDQRDTALAKISHAPPIKIIGDMSYSIYLWHWPVIFIARTAFDLEGTNFFSVTIVVLLTLALAKVTMVCVENPVRSIVIDSSRQKYFFIGAVSASAIIVLPSLLFLVQVRSDEEQAVMVGKTFKTPSEIRALVQKTLNGSHWPETHEIGGVAARTDEWIIDDCLDVQSRSDIARCTYGLKTSDATMLVIGDSWANHLLPGIRLAFGDSMKIEVYTLSQCPIANLKVSRWDNSEFTQCESHREDVLSYISDTQPALIIASDSMYSTYQRIANQNGVERRSLLAAAVENSFRDLSKKSVPVVFIESPPRANCTPENQAAPYQCEPNTGTALEIQLSRSRRVLAREHNIGYIDMSEYLCSPDYVCPAQVGPYMVKADPGHFTNLFSSRLSAVLAQQIQAQWLSIVGESTD